MRSQYIKTLFRHFIIWTLAFAFWTIMRDFGHEVVRDYQPNFLQQIRLHLAFGIIAGILFGSLDYLFQNKVIHQVSFGRALFMGTISYLLAFILMTVFGVQVFARVLQFEVDEAYQNFMFSQEWFLLAFYCYIIGFMIDFFKEVDKKFGPGNLLKMLKGEFYEPKEDERIFMFLDLKSSTAIAEKLGHIQYSKLIQDCFQDLRVVKKYQAEVYQYVGDEAVLTWDRQTGLTNSNCLKAYIEFEKRLEERADYYNKNYGLTPVFKAGLNVGKITIAEVGELKTEIAYHGDTINTAARIQEQCNIFGKNLLISETLQQNLQLNGFSSLHVGEILLKGKRNAINIYSVEY
ncbi:MAG: adenylate/guanylate cyclase domain-containing protein [Bacteroidota bacterium]